MEKMTAKWLESKFACNGKIKKFKKLFGESADVSYKNMEIWCKNNRRWRYDMLWLFCVSIKPTTFGKNLKKLAKYLAAEKSTFFWEQKLYVKNSLFKIEPQRIKWAMTQIIYMIGR